MPFPWRLHHFTFPPAVHEASNVTTSSPTANDLSQRANQVKALPVKQDVRVCEYVRVSFL